MELTFDTDDKDVPKMIETILQLYTILQEPTDNKSQKTVIGRSQNDDQSMTLQPPRAPLMSAAGGMSALELGS